METIDEELQILQGERLAGKEAPLRLDSSRAAGFIDSVIKAEREARRRSRLRMFVWGGSALAFAGCIAAAVIMVSTPQGVRTGRLESVHASGDSISAAAADSLAMEDVQIAVTDE